MKKILFITHQLSRTGAPIVLIDMINVCINQGVQPEVISMMDGELRKVLENMGINVTIRDNFVKDWEEFRRYACGFNAVVANTLITYQVIHILNGADVPVIWWLHEGEQYFEYFKTVIPDMAKLKNNIHIYSVGQYVQDVAKRRYGIETDILHMGVKDYNGVLKDYAADNSIEERMSDKKVRFLIVGTYSTLKGQDILVEALSELPEKMMNNAEFLFCGNETMYDQHVFETVCNACMLYNNVRRIDSQTHDNIIQIMDKCDYLIVPSRVDPIPTVAVEAMMMYKPCIITDVCGAAYYMTDAKDSLKVNAEDVSALRTSICRAISIRLDSGEQYNAMCKAARRIYDEHFSEQIFEEKVTKILDIGNKRGRIIFMTGLYDILDIFTYELIDEFKNMGYETFEFDTSDMRASLGKLYDFIKEPVKAVITFNNLGYNMELVEGQNVWEQLEIPCINILMDHPFCHKKALDASPANAIVLCVDRNHMKYLQRFYPQIPIVGFLPHGGKKKYSEHKKIADRNIDVIYAGGISRGFAYGMMPDFEQFKFDAKSVADAAYNSMIANPYKTTEAAIEEELIKRGIRLNDDELCDVIEKLHYVDLLIVSYYREKVVRTLVENGVRVTLYGTGWDVCDWLDNPNLDYRGRVSAEEIVDRMQDAKIVLSTMTWFKDGTHDRVFNGMLAGAVAITDSSIYMMEEFDTQIKADRTDNRELIMFELNEIEKLPLTVKGLLADTDLMQEIADRGYKKALASHTWQARAHELEKDLISIL